MSSLVSNTSCIKSIISIFSKLIMNFQLFMGTTELSIKYPKWGYWAPVSPSRKWEVRMKIVHTEEKQGTKLVFSAKLVFMGVFTLRFGFAFACALTAAHILHYIKGCQNKILKIFLFKLIPSFTTSYPILLTLQTLSNWG